jgi:polyphenol oxidase
MANAITLYQSTLIPDSFLHGFPERHGGVSQGLRSSLNLGFRWGDNAAHVEENRRILAAHVGYLSQSLQVTKHVHGTNVWRVGESMPDPAEFDGLVCDRPGPILGAFAADCMPVLFADPVRKICGACHAGWRGTVDGVAQNVVANMVELGTDVRDIVAVVGPSIGPCCFEVGSEVVEQFVARFGHVADMVLPQPSSAKPHIDLRRAMRHALQSVGVSADKIDDAPPCTKCNPDRFFSYRRDGLAGGVHMGYIGLRDT